MKAYVTYAADRKKSQGSATRRERAAHQQGLPMRMQAVLHCVMHVVY